LQRDIKERANMHKETITTAASTVGIGGLRDQISVMAITISILNALH